VPRVWTLTQGDIELDVTMSAPVEPKVVKEVVAHPVIGRVDPRVLNSGSRVRETSYEVSIFNADDDEDMTTLCDSDAVVTVTDPDGADEQVTIKSSSRVVPFDGLYVYKLETVRSI